MVSGVEELDQLVEGSAVVLFDQSDQFGETLPFEGRRSSSRT